MMKWGQAVKKLSSELAEPFELEFVWRNLNELDKLAWLNLQSEEISDKELSALTEIAGRLKRHEPPQYIMGWSEFCGLCLDVDKRVLIPRPETEELVEKVLAENHSSNLTVLDMGTGSGAIAISLAHKRPSWQLTASDVSAGALEVARSNAVKNGLSIAFIQSDALENIHQTFDIIVSNPPYIARADIMEVDRSVKAFEPQEALFADHDGLAIYEKLAAQAPAHLAKSGKIYLEIGYKQGAAVKALFGAAFPEKTITVYQDSFGKDRIVSVR